MQDTIAVSVTLLVWILGILLGAVAGLFTLCGHLLISIYKGMRTLTSTVDVGKEHVDGRLVTLERHDKNNEEQKNMFISFLSKQKEKA